MCKVQRGCREGADADAEVQRCRGGAEVQRSRCRAGVQMQSRCRGAGVQSTMCRGSEYLHGGFRRGDYAGNCAEEVQIWRCSDRHAEVQVIVQAQWWLHGMSNHETGEEEMNALQ